MAGRRKLPMPGGRVRDLQIDAAKSNRFAFQTGPETPQTTIDAVNNERREANLLRIFNAMTHTDDPVTREPTVALFEVAKLIQTELLNEEGPLGAWGRSAPAMHSSPMAGQSPGRLGRLGSGGGHGGGAQARTPSPLELMSTRLKDRISGDEFLEPLLENMGSSLGVVTQDHAELGLLQLPLQDFCTLLKEMYDDNGRLVQHASIFGAQTKALTRVMTSIEDELHESLLENDDLSTTLESKTEQFTIDYNELVNTSTQQTTEMLDKLDQMVRDLQKSKVDTQQAKAEHQRTKDELAELQESTKHERMPERKRKELEALKVENEKLQHVSTRMAQISDELSASDKELAKLKGVIVEKEKHIDDLVEELKGSGAATLRQHLAEAEGELQRQAAFYENLLRDANDQRRSRYSSASSLRPNSANEDLRAELGEAFQSGGSGGDGEPLARPPSMWGLSQDGKTPRHSVHSSVPSNRSSVRASSRSGTAASLRTSTESMASAGGARPQSFGSPPEIMTPTNDNRAGGNESAAADAAGASADAQRHRSVSAGAALATVGGDDGDQTPVQAQKPGRQSFGLNNERRRHSVEMSAKNDVIEALKKEKAEMLEEFTNLALAKAELEAEPQLQGSDAGMAANATNGGAAGVGPHGRNVSHTADSLEAMLAEQDRQLLEALHGEGRNGAQGSAGGDGRGGAGGKRGNRSLTRKVTVEVVKEVVQRRINGDTGDARVMRDTRNARTEVYFTTKSIRTANDGPWTEEEATMLKRACREHTITVLPMNIDFVAVAAMLPGRSDRACKLQWKSLRRGRSAERSRNPGSSSSRNSRTDRDSKDRSSRRRGHERSTRSTGSSWSGRSRTEKSLSPSHKSRFSDGSNASNGAASKSGGDSGGRPGSQYNSQSSFSSGNGLNFDDADREWFGAPAYSAGGGGSHRFPGRRASTHAPPDGMAAAAVASPRYTDRILPASGVVGV